jgi:hypothetical protein
MTTEQVTPEGEEAAPVELPVMFMDREIYARMPSPEQLIVWQRTIKRLETAPMDASWTGSEVMAALERLRKIVDTLMVNRADIDWLDEQFLDETVTFQTLAPFITDVVTAFQEFAAAQGNREARRATKKAAPKKAARKKATA